MAKNFTRIQSKINLKAKKDGSLTDNIQKILTWCLL